VRLPPVVDASLDVAARPQAQHGFPRTRAARAASSSRSPSRLEAISGKDVQDCMLGLVGRERRPRHALSEICKTVARRLSNSSVWRSSSKG